MSSRFAKKFVALAMGSVLFGCLPGCPCIWPLVKILIAPFRCLFSFCG